MSQSWHPEDSDWRDGLEDDNSVASLRVLLERPVVVPVIFPQRSSDMVPQQPHIVLCSAYDDDDEDCEE